MGDVPFTSSEANRVSRRGNGDGDVSRQVKGEKDKSKLQAPRHGSCKMRSPYPISLWSRSSMMRRVLLLPFPSHPSRRVPQKLFVASNEDMGLSLRTSCLSWILTSLAYVAPTLLPSKLELGESMVVCNPQRVLWQFDFDEGSMSVRGDTFYLNLLIEGQGKLEILLSFQRIIYKALWREGMMSLGGVLFWTKCKRLTVLSLGGQVLARVGDAVYSEG